MEGLAKSRNITPHLAYHHTKTHQNNHKMAVLEQNHLLKGKFLEVFY